MSRWLSSLFFIFNIYLLCVYGYLLYVGVGAHVCTMVYMWKSEDNFQESVLTFHHVGPGDWTDVDRLGAGMLTC